MDFARKAEQLRIRQSPLFIVLLLLSTSNFAQDPNPDLPGLISLYSNPSKPSSVTISCLREERRLAECLITIVKIYSAPGETYRKEKLAKFEASKDEIVKGAFENRSQICTDESLDEFRDLLDSQSTQEATSMLEAGEDAFRTACSAKDLSRFSAAMSRVAMIETDIESRTCRIESTNYRWPFKYQGTVGDGFWYYQSEPSIDCGAFVMATIRGSGREWTFDQRMIVTNSDGKGYLQSCDSIDTEPKFYSSRQFTFYALDCPFVKFK